MLKAVVLTMLTISNPNGPQATQQVEMASTVFYANRSWDAYNVCRRVGEQFLKNTPAVKTPTGDKMYERVFTCDGTTQLEYYLNKSFKKEDK